jgi:sugar/nucleoside kinase (ribokinase family)
MYDIITIGAVTIDILMKSPAFHLEHRAEGVLLCEQYGEKIDVSECVTSVGGAAANTAVGFARLGFRVATVAELGRDLYAQYIYDVLKKARVDTSHLVMEKGEDTAVSVLLISSDGGRTALTHRAAASQLEARDVPWSVLQKARWIHLSNVGGSPELLLPLFDHVRKSLAGLSWCPGRVELELLRTGGLQIEHVPCDILMLNEDEWALIASLHDRVWSSVPLVVVTKGRTGGVVYQQGGYELPFTAPQVKTVQETGAGDAFATGFVAGHLFGLPLSECVQWGKTQAASVVQHMGAQRGLLTRQEIVLQHAAGEALRAR